MQNYGSEYTDVLRIVQKIEFVKKRRKVKSSTKALLQERNILKFSTSFTHHLGQCKKQEIYVTDFKMSICPAPKTTGPDNRNSGFFVP